MNVLNFLFIKLKNKFNEYIYYPKVRKCMNKYNVIGIMGTIKSLINNKKSLSRFGDGEINCIVNKYIHDRFRPCGFQDNNSLLTTKLIEVLHSNNPDLEIGLPDIFTGDKQFTYKPKLFWRGTMAYSGKYFLKYLNMNKQYYDTGFSRCYIDYKNKIRSGIYFKLAKKIWDNKSVVIIEGKDSRIGVGNNLFLNAKDIKRIECPSTNAFRRYNEILNSSLKILQKNDVALIALGPTATILSYDLAKKGYKAIDIGQMDLEYEWYLMGTKNRINIPYKYVNEVPNGNVIVPMQNKSYNDEIVKII